MPKILEDEKIYQAVMQVVAERGYAGATTKQMADAAGISEVTLFRKYENKAGLVKRAIAAIVEESNFTSAAHYTGDVSADLLRVVRAYQDTAVRYGYFFAALFSEVTRHPELLDALDQPLDIFRAIGELVVRYQAEGILQREHPAHAVAALLGPMMYAALMRGALPDAQLPPIDLSAHVASYLEGRQASKPQF
jgi:AcrR family transcriptional regulator